MKTIHHIEATIRALRTEIVDLRASANHTLADAKLELLLDLQEIGVEFALVDQRLAEVMARRAN